MTLTPNQIRRWMQDRANESPRLTALEIADLLRMGVEVLRDLRGLAWVKCDIDPLGNQGKVEGARGDWLILMSVHHEDLPMDDRETFVVTVQVGNCTFGHVRRLASNLCMPADVLEPEY